MKEKKQPLRLLKLFDYNRGNTPDADAEDTRPTFKRYFKLLGRRFWKLITLNIMMLAMVLPIFLMLFLYLGVKQTPTAENPLFAALYGANILDPTPTSTLLLDLFGKQLNIPVYDYSTYIWMGLCILFLAVTFGWQNVGTTYILRGMVRGEPVFVWSDYWYGIKRNLKQGFLLGLIDVFVLVLLALDIIYLSSMPSSFLNDFMFFSIVALAVLYFFVRFYIYLLSITFDLSIRKIFKNALIFSVLGVKRNLMGALGIVLLTAINVLLIAWLLPMNNPLPLILPCFYYLAFTAFTAAYAAYPIIHRYMIEPYQNRDEDETEEEPEELSEPQ